MNQDLITNRYEIIREIGKCGKGTVWVAKSKRTGQEVAINIIQLTPFNRDIALQDISAIKSIPSPNCTHYVVSYHDSFYDPTTNQAVIEMEYIRGPNIAQYTQPLRNQGNRVLLIRTTKLLLKAMLIGLKFIHSYNVLHNDIKPSNIVVGSNKVPELVDFGISCFVQEAIRAACTQPYGKMVGNCCNTTSGTSIYLPPESTKNVRYPSSDLWSLAATAYEIMTGTNIWGLNVVNYDPMGLMREVVNRFNSVVLPDKLNSGDPNLDGVVNSFLNYDPAARMSIDQALALL